MQILQLGSLPHIDQDKRHPKSIAAMIKKLTQRWTWSGPSGLFSVNGIHRGIDPETDSCIEKAPRWNGFFECEIVEKDDDSWGEENKKTYESDEVGGDPFRYKCDHVIPVGSEKVVNCSVFAWFVLVSIQLLNPFGSYVLSHL